MRASWPNWHSRCGEPNRRLFASLTSGFSSQKCPATLKMLEDPVLGRIARRRGGTVAQVVLRWNVEHGVLPIPSSVNPGHQRDNLRAPGMVLTREEVAEIDGLSRET